MRSFHLQLPIRAAVSSLVRPTAPIVAEGVSRLRIEANNAIVSGRRYASVKSQGQYKLAPRKTIPKKLGAKRTGDQFVIPGNILYKQRGTLWWPGENCIMGRDHTIHAMASGYVKYYRDPAKHPDRKYIGVVFNKDDTLPYPKDAERKRRHGLTAHTIVPRVEEPELSASGIPTQIIRPGNVGLGAKAKGGPSRILRLRDDYSYREDNWRIGRLVKLEGVMKTKGGQGHRQSRRARFRSRRWRSERAIQDRKKSAEKLENQQVDEWTLAAQKRAQEQRDKKLKAQKDKKKQAAEQQARARAASIRRSAAKKAGQ